MVAAYPLGMTSAPHGRDLPTGGPDDRRGRELEEAIVAFTGCAPSFTDYQRVYAQLGQPYPGDDTIARTCPVAS